MASKSTKPNLDISALNFSFYLNYSILNLHTFQELQRVNLALLSHKYAIEVNQPIRKVIK